MGPERETIVDRPLQDLDGQSKDRRRTLEAKASPAPSRGPRSERPFWREDLAPYAKPDLGRSMFELATSVFPSPALLLAIAVPAAGFLVRTFIIFHDCSHGSFLRSKRANAWLGTVLGLFVYSPFLRWRPDHPIHHATSGDLDRRGGGDVRTLTVAEYHALTPKGRFAYRLFRNPVVMFGLGPIAALLVGPRIVARNARPRM